MTPCAHRKLNVRQNRTTPKPETYHSGGRSCAGNFLGAAASEKIEHQNVHKQHSHHHHHHHYHVPHDSKQHTRVELVRAYRLAVAAAACCCYFGNEDTPPPNEARAISREGRGAKPDGAIGRRGKIISAQGGTTRKCVIYLLAAWMADLGGL